MTKFRNYNQGRVKELIENALREVVGDLQFLNIGTPYNYEEFDPLPENHLSNELNNILIKCYNTDTGETLAILTIQEKHLNYIQDKKCNDRKHEYNLFRKYVTIILLSTNKIITLCKQELTCPEDCTCKMCFSDDNNRNSDFYGDLSKYDNPYYNDNLDFDQQSQEYWDNI